jgi:choline kinase
VIGMVLAAGTGRRLRPDTDALPKTLLPVAGETTILDIALRNLAAAGAAEVVIVVGFAAEQVADRVAGLERKYGITIDLVHNDRAREWNNAYSLWLAREYFGRGVLLLNGDTVHPASVEKTLLAVGAGKRGHADPMLGRLIIAIDDIKLLADEEMKVILDARGAMCRITKAMDPSHAHGEYMGVTLIEPSAAIGLADALEATWRRDPGLYYEDGFAEFAKRGGEVLAAPIGAVEWVEVDDHRDLRRARQIAQRC